MSVPVVLAVDLGGGTKLSSALFAESGQVVHKEVAPLAGRVGREVGDLVSQQIQSLLAECGQKGLVPRPLGVSVPGIAYAASGRVWAPNIPGGSSTPCLRRSSPCPECRH